MNLKMPDGTSRPSRRERRARCDLWTAFVVSGVNRIAGQVFFHALLLTLITLGIAQKYGTPAAAQEYQSLPDTDLPLADRVCATCHGAEGQGSPVVGGPSLAGLEPWYLTRQLRAFRAGHRGSQSDDTPAYEMQHSVDELSDDEIETVAEEIAAWPVKPPEPTITGNLENGARHYIQCAVCHGPRAEGNAALGAPALTGRNDWYLFRQIKLFQSGARGTHRDDPWGRLMLAPARILKTDQQINDVLAYINQL